MTKTVNKEEGKVDRVADGPNNTQLKPEGDGEQATHRSGWVNGEAVDDVDATTRGNTDKG